MASFQPKHATQGGGGGIKEKKISKVPAPPPNLASVLHGRKKVPSLPVIFLVGCGVKPRAMRTFAPMRHVLTFGVCVCVYLRGGDEGEGPTTPDFKHVGSGAPRGVAQR